MIRRPRRSTLFPYPPLFRPRVLRGEYTRRGPDAEQRPIDKDIDDARDHYMKEEKAVVNDVVDTAKRAAQAFTDAFNKKTRSEEHTSELQSQSNLVCRLLLEK